MSLEIIYMHFIYNKKVLPHRGSVLLNNDGKNMSIASYAIASSIVLPHSFD